MPMSDPNEAIERLLANAAAAQATSEQQAASIEALRAAAATDLRFYEMAPLPPPPRDYTKADTFYESLHALIRQAEADLESGEALEVYAQTTLGSMLVTNLDYRGPNILILHGFRATVEGPERATVLAHMNTVQISMHRVKREQPTPKRPIGFGGIAE